MRTRIGAILVGMLCVPVLVSAGGGAVEIKTVKYKELGDVVAQNRGKVVVVDFWGDFCIPCKKEFPHLVELHQKYAAQGLAAISVAVDPQKEDPQEREVLRQRLLKFLTKMKATFTNLYLDEPAELWQKKLDIAEVPCIFVFDRQGKYYRFGGSADAPRKAEYSQIEPLVIELLKKK
jgi:thiol-disulfide isomerase/thioredoxin